MAESEDSFFPSKTCKMSGDCAADAALHSDLEERLARFGASDPLPKYKINRFDPIHALSAFGDLLQSHELLLCACQQQCNCKKGKVCQCDDDNSATLKLRKADVLSNCRFMLEFAVDTTLAYNKKKQYLRGFHLNEETQEEATRFDLYADLLVAYTPSGELHFALDEVYSYRHGQLTITFDYMRYEEA
jgi:hypothetical protein